MGLNLEGVIKGQGGENLQRENWKGESRAVLAVTRWAQGRLWVTMWAGFVEKY